MPVVFIEAPPGIRTDAKKMMVEKITTAMEEAYPLPADNRIFLREYPLENVGQDGRLESEPVRPVCFIEAPQLRSLDARRKLIKGIDAAVAEAYEGVANIRETLILFNEYPLENAGWAGRLQSENPEFVEAIKKLNG
jgi:phenylpyruvate tautomerase PptA (4-oxalocrotonate tautomerase family)